MLIHLMQHGACLPKELDEHQPLSPIGNEQITKAAKAAQKLGIQFELIVASSKVRSRQTAEIMAQHTNYPLSRIEISEAVNALTPPAKTIEFIKEYDGLDSILITGHQPSIGALASTLLVGTQQLNLRVENGGLLQLDLPQIEGKASLNWYLSPTQLALISQ